MARAVTLMLTVALVAVACGDTGEPAEAVIDPGDGGDYEVSLGPADVVSAIDNRYWPFLPGSTWVYEAEEDGEVERIEVEVLADTRLVDGITATVVRDRVFVDGELIEDTFDWYAQDTEGNVWYLGEDSTEYEDGEVVTTAGSWEAGVDGALAGIVMQADPQVGEAYRQEYYEGEAEDMAEVVETGLTVTVPAGTFENVLRTKEWTPLEPDVVEEKFYAPGVGVIKEQKVRGETGTAELIAYDVTS